MPRPGTRVIPDGWEAHHAPAAEGAMTATCRVTRNATPAGGRAFDEAGGRTIYGGPATVYEGPCRLQRTMMRPQTVEVGGQQQTPHDYQLALPLSSQPLQVNDVVEMTAATDSTQAGLRLRVIGVPAGSLLWQRDYLTQEWDAATR